MFICLSVFRWDKELRSDNVGNGVFRNCVPDKTYYTILDTNDGCIELLTSKELEVCHDKRIPIKGLDWYKRGKNFIIRPVIIPKTYDCSEIRKLCGYNVSDLLVDCYTSDNVKVTNISMLEYFCFYVIEDNGSKRHIVDCKVLEPINNTSILIKLLTLDINISVDIKRLLNMIK